MDLRAAINDGALEIHYQPLIDIASGAVCAYEALLRWPHSERGMIPPAEFIPIAEETGLIGTIGAFVLRQACADARQWPEHTKIAVNLSPLQFRTGNLLQVVMGALEAAQLPPSRLELEITETLLLERSEQVLATLHALRALGVRIAMDDFGTGYCSLSYLRSFPFDKIKIDRSFVRDLGSNLEAQAIVRAIVTLGSSLGVTITAEGVETLHDLEKLRLEGCAQAQGFLFSEPRPLRDILVGTPARKVA
jgi:EAL domain-containing protein (putative c-di-GMP-specific phosphodiesterase class I)